MFPKKTAAQLSWAGRSVFHRLAVLKKDTFFVCVTASFLTSRRYHSYAIQKAAGQVAENACKAKHNHYTQIPNVVQNRNLSLLTIRTLFESGDVKARKFFCKSISLAASVLWKHRANNILL